MAGSVVRVDPASVDFTDVRVGQVYKTTITARNVGKVSRNIIIEKPRFKLFKFTVTTPSAVVAPGLCVSGVLQFTPQNEEMVRDRLLVHADDMETIEIPLRVFPRACALQMDSLVDFGCVPASREIISKHHPITNQGAAPGVFHVQYSGDSPIKLSPSSGVVAGGATKWLQVDLRTDRPMKVKEKALVKLQNRFPVLLTVIAEVEDQRLEVFDMKGNPLSCLRFGPLYFGTSSVENVILRNNSPQACDWVCLPQDSAPGTEMGRNLQKSTDAVLLESKENSSPGSQVMFCIPQQGRLQAYEKTIVAIRFSPVFKCTSERTRHCHSGSRQDYCLFLLFETAGSKHGFTHQSGNSSVELAVTGSGLPVSLVPSPSHKFDFPACVVGQHAELLCVLRNLCTQIPVKFHFRKLAQFTTNPVKGTIAPGQCQDVVLTFTAHQFGSFQVFQILDVLGPVHQSSDIMDATQLKLCSFHSVTLHLSAVSHSENVFSASKPTSGVSMQRGCHLRTCDVANAFNTKRTNKSEKSQCLDEEDFLTKAIEQVSTLRQYRTASPCDTRYHEVSYNFDLTEEEEQQKYRNQQFYAEFFKQLRQTRLSRIKEEMEEKAEREVDINLVPAQGLVPPKLQIRDIDISDILVTKLNEKDTLTQNKYSWLREGTATNQNNKPQVSEVIGAVPCNDQERAECNRTLTAHALCHVVIGPLLVDFGEVCVHSVCIQKLELTNRLSTYIWVQLEVECPELHGSSPLSHVLPPCSHTTVPLTFQSNKLGHFYSPVSYTVNQQHPGQILVQAHVVPVALQLSTTLLVLRPCPGLLAHSGYRSSITLRNCRNQAAEFTWRPIFTEKGISFSIRPATGTVEPQKELDCEVVWHPSFTSPAEGDFEFCVHDGNIQQLHCVAKIGSTQVQLSEKQLIFGSVPLNMPSVRTAIFHNAGPNHAYYQVQDLSPLPGMIVSPWEGVIPCGGQSALKVLFTPNSVIKFDTRVKISMRNMKSIELRVNGSVEPPNVEVSVPRFQFSVVHAGSRRKIPFTLTNHSSAAARLTFDLSRYTDFTVHLPHPSTKREAGVSVMEVQSKESIHCSLVLSPTQVAGYDFDLPLICNGERWLSASSSSAPTPSFPSLSSSMSALTWKHMVQHSRCVGMLVPHSLRIQATVVCAPVEMSPSSLQFHMDALVPQTVQSKLLVNQKTVELKAVCEQSICWRSISSKRLNWWFKCSSIADPVEGSREKALCSASPSSGCLGPGQSVSVTVSITPEVIPLEPGGIIPLSLLLYLEEEGQSKGEEQHPYRELDITITVRPLSLTFHPPQILLPPVPLQSSTTATLTLLAVGYPIGTKILAEVDDVELDNGTKIQPLSVVFPEGNSLSVLTQEQRHSLSLQHQEATVTSLTCNVSFCSALPVSLCTAITFTEQYFNERFQVTTCATTDNCLLTVWPYMARNRTEQQIVLKTGATVVEAVLQRCHTPSPLSGLASSLSSFDHESGTNKTSASGSFPESGSLSGQNSRDEEVSSTERTPLNFSVPEFPAADSEEGLYYQTVLLAVERWFSLFGWPNGPHPISVPHTLRRIVLKAQTQETRGRTYRVTQNKDCRSVLDMLQHLIGEKIPGIPYCEVISNDKQQRIDQVLQQHEAVLAFLRGKGACVKHIRPEYLLDAQEFKHCCRLKSKKDDNGLSYGNVGYESLSKRSWTDVLLQIYKVSVLRRVSKSGQSTVPNQGDGVLSINSKSVASNVYSPNELLLLSWLNEHYQSMRQTFCGAGSIPMARWIVNFDLDFSDGLVLAALLAAYCPYLISSHFKRMYTTPNTLEQILHNNIIVVQCLTALSLNIDIQPTDLSDPNPVQILMLCVHLYEKLPQYLPMQTITLTGSLHSTFSKKVRLRTPSSHPKRYQTFLLGENAYLFSLTDGSAVSVLPKTGAELTIRYRCFFMQPMEAVLLLISSPAFGELSTTLAFSLKANVSHITPTSTVKHMSPCYELRVIQLSIANPFSKEAKFRVVLVESTYNPLEPEKKHIIQRTSFRSKPEKVVTDSCGEVTEGRNSAQNVGGKEFFSAVRTVSLKPRQTFILNIHYLPFSTGVKYCSVLLVCPQVGDMVHMVKTSACFPLPSPVKFKPSSDIVSIPNSSVVGFCCLVDQVWEGLLCVPLVNMAWERALAIWGQLSMSVEEQRRRLLTQTLYSSSVRASTVSKLFKREAQRTREITEDYKVITYNIRVTMPQYFRLPSTVEIPVTEETNVPWENPSDCESVEIPIWFQADRVGQFPCQVVLKSSSDTRLFMLEAHVTSQMKQSVQSSQ